MRFKHNSKFIYLNTRIYLQISKGNGVYTLFQGVIGTCIYFFYIDLFSLVLSSLFPVLLQYYAELSVKQQNSSEKDIENNFEGLLTPFLVLMVPVNFDDITVRVAKGLFPGKTK